MAQVIKLQEGGSLVIDGQKLDGKSALKRLRDLYDSTPVENRGKIGVAMRAVSEGNTFKINSDNNLPQIYNKEGEDITSEYVQGKGNTGASTFSRNIDAILKTGRHQDRLNWQQLFKVNMSPETIVKPETPKKQLGRGEGWFSYNPIKDKNGKITEYKWVEGINNDSIEDTLRDVIDYVNNNSSYDTSKWKGNETTLDKLKGYEDLGNSGYLNNLMNRAKSHNLSKEDIEFLNAVGYKESSSPTTTSAGSPASGSGSAGTTETDKEEGNPLNIGGIKFYKGSDNKIHISTNQDKDYEKYKEGNWVLAGNPLFKDTDYKNGYIYNGILYNSDQAKLNINIARTAINPFLDKKMSLEDRYKKMKSSGWHFYGDENEGLYGKDYSFDPNEFYNPLLMSLDRNKKYGVADITNRYSNVTDSERTKIYMYIDPAYVNEENGILIPRYIYKEPYKRPKFYESEDEMVRKHNLTMRDVTEGIGSTIDKTSWITGRDNDEYAKYGEFGNSAIKNSIFVDRNGTFYLDLGNKRYKKIDDIGASGDDLINLIDNIIYKFDTVNFRDINKDIGLLTKRGVGYRTWNNLFNTGNVERHQFGGFFDTKKEVIDSSKARHDIMNAHALDGSDGGLTSNEWLQLGAAAADLAGVGLSFIPGAGGILGAATGAAGSTARLVSDIKKDGFQAGDAGRFLGNILLDTASLLPMVGFGAKTMKAVKTIKNTITPIIKILSIANVGSATINTAKKIANGEKFTSDDLSQVIQGIASSVIAAKGFKDDFSDAKLARRLVKDIKNEPVKISEANKVINIKREEIEDIVKANRNNKENVIEELVGKKELNPKEKDKLLKDLHIDVKNKLKLRNSKGEFLRHDEVLSYNTPKLHSVATLFFNPFKRADILGSKNVFGVYGKLLGNKSGFLNRENLSLDDILAANNSVNQPLKRVPWYQMSIARISSENPKAFGINIGDDSGFYYEYRNPWTFGGRRYFIQRKSIDIPKSPMTNIPLSKPTATLKSGGKIQKIVKCGNGISNLPGKGDYNRANLLDTIDIVRTIGDINRDRNIRKSALDKLYNRQFIAPYINHTRLDLSPVEHAFNKSKQPILLSNIVTSSPEASMSYNLQKAQQLSNLEAQKAAATTQEILANKAQNDKIDFENNRLATDAANQRSQYITNLDYQKRMMDSEALNRKDIELAKYSNQMRQQARQSQNLTNQAIEEQELNSVKLDRQRYIDNALQQYKEDFTKNNEKFDNFEDWMIAKHPDEYNKVIIEANNRVKNKLLEIKKRSAESLSDKIFFKKGGKVHNWTVSDEIAVETIKSAQRAVTKLSDNLMRMLSHIIK